MDVRQKQFKPLQSWVSRQDHDPVPGRYRNMLYRLLDYATKLGLS